MIARLRLDEHEVPQARVRGELFDVLEMSAQHRFDLRCGAVGAPDPDDLGMRFRDLGAFVEIGVLGHDRETVLDRVALDRVIARAFERERSYVYRAGKNT